MLCDVVAGFAKKVTESSHIYKPEYDRQLLPLPKASPPRDDLFIDDTSDVDVNAQYVVVVILCQVYYILPVIHVQCAVALVCYFVYIHHCSNINITRCHQDKDCLLYTSPSPRD